MQSRPASGLACSLLHRLYVVIGVLFMQYISIASGTYGHRVAVHELLCSLDQPGLLELHENVVHQRGRRCAQICRLRNEGRIVLSARSRASSQGWVLAVAIKLSVIWVWYKPTYASRMA
jgi:hypothetical protein